MISIIIPHKNRHSLLYMVLDKLNEQTIFDFETIVVDDGSDIFVKDWIGVLFPDFVPKYELVFVRNPGKGPNAARNHGVSLAKYDNIVISGSDTIPSRSFVMQHILELKRDSDKIIQGYTPFHPQVMDTEFMVWLNNSGIQANWAALQTESGWRRDADGFCLTTNLSMTKQVFENIGGLSEGFPGAAWDDIEFGIRARKLGVQTIFSPRAINFHYHKYNISQFANRQIMEGKNRIYLCYAHPEMAMQLMDINAIKTAEEQSLDEWLHQAVELSYINGCHEEKDRVWRGVLQLASFKGVVESLEPHPVLRLIKLLANQESVVYLFALLKAHKDGNTGYVDHCLGWLSEKEPVWVSELIAGEIALMDKNNTEAIIHFNNSLTNKYNVYAEKRLK